MPGLSVELLGRLRETLIRCVELDTDTALRTVFVVDDLLPFRDGLSQAASKSARIDQLIDYLLSKQLRDGRTMLPLFLQTLAQRYNENDIIHTDLLTLAQEFSSSRFFLTFANREAEKAATFDFLHSEHSYAFANREDDLRKIYNCLETHPYLHLYAPSGIGKTYLAQHLYREKYTQHPFAYIDFNASQHRSQGRSIEEMLIEILRQFKCAPAPLPQPLILDDLLAISAQPLKQHSHYGVVVLDNLDRAAPTIRGRFRKEVLPVLQNKIGNPRLYVRFIAITQSEMEELGGVGPVTFQPYGLEAFHGGVGEHRTYKDLIRQAIKNFGEREISNDDPHADTLLNQWAAILFELTGGHPGAITGILDYVGRETKFANERVFSDNQLAICQNVLTPLIEQQVQVYFREQEYQLAFQSLWVFRRLSNGIFRQLLYTIKDKELWKNLNAVVRFADYGTEHTPLWENFKNTPLLQSNEVSRLLSHPLTPLWRRMGNMVLKLADVAVYTELHRDARRVFDHFMSQDDPAMQIDCFVEALYHFTQEHSGLLSDQIRYEFTENTLKRLRLLLYSLKNKGSFEEYLHSLKVILEKDRELQVELNRAGQSNTWEQVKDYLVQTLKHPQHYDNLELPRNGVGEKWNSRSEIGFRFYKSTDDTQLKNLDQLCPQGSGISVYHRCTRFAAHAEMFQNHFTMVAEYDGEAIGVASGALKKAWFGEEKLEIGYLFDLRVHPNMRKRGIADRLIRTVEDVLESKGAKLLYAIIMQTNAPALNLLDKLGYETFTIFQTEAIPIYRYQRVTSQVNVLRSPKEIRSIVNPYFEGFPFFVSGTERYPQSGEYEFFYMNTSDSFAGICKSTRKRVFEEVINSLTPPIKIARFVFNLLQPAYPMPNIPREDEVLSAWWLGEPIVQGRDGPRLLQEVMSHINNKALESQINSLLIPLDTRDPVWSDIQNATRRDLISKVIGRWATVKSVLLIKSTADVTPQTIEPVFADTRDF